MTSSADLTLQSALAEAPREGARADVDAHARAVTFGRLVREHAGTLYGLARRLGPEASEAEDLVQDALLKAWKGYGRFRHEADLRTWLYRILVNVCHDRRRRGVLRLVRRRAERSPPDPAQRTDRRDLVERVLAGVEVLPRRQRECLLLRARGGFSHREIASVLGIREGVVKVHLVRARRALLRRFGEEVKECGIEKR